MLKSLFRSKTLLPSTNKVVVVTGCDQGFGKATALKLVDQGYTVFAGCLNALNSSNDDTYKKIQQTSGNRLQFLQMDVTSEQQCRDSVAKVGEWLGDNPNHGLCSVVANAGVAHMMESELLSEKLIRNTFDVNYFGVFRTFHNFLPLLREAKGKVENRSLVALSSYASVFPTIRIAYYAGSKAAVLQHANCLRVELARFGIRVAVVCPDFYATDMVVNENQARAKLEAIYKEGDENFMKALNSYGGMEKHRKHVDKMLKVIGNSARTDISPVIDSIVDAIASSNPKQTYWPVNSRNRMYIALRNLPPGLLQRLQAILMRS